MSRPWDGEQVYWQNAVRTPPNAIYAVPAVRLPVGRLAAASRKRKNNATRYEWTRKDARHAAVL